MQDSIRISGLEAYFVEVYTSFLRIYMLDMTVLPVFYLFHMVKSAKIRLHIVLALFVCVRSFTSLT